MEWEITLAITSAAGESLGVQTVWVYEKHVLSTLFRAAKRTRRGAFKALRKKIRDNGHLDPATRIAWTDFRAASKAEKK